MTRNQAILAELMKYMDEIKVRICLKNIKLYEIELSQLRDTIEQSLKISHRSSFFEKNEVVKSIMKIIDEINYNSTSNFISDLSHIEKNDL